METRRRSLRTEAERDPAAPGQRTGPDDRPHTGARPARAERLALATAAVLFASGLFHLGVFAVAGGPWDGPVSWRKPATFGLSFGLTLAALTWVTSYVRTGARVRAVLLGLLAADSVLEVAGITLQAWRKVPSHLDMETPFDSAVSMTLAVGGGLLVVILTYFAVAAFRRPPSGPAAMALAVRAGFAILLVALASGAAMIARGVVLTRTGHQLAAYASTAPLKPLHGVSLHAVLVLPALAWLLSRTSLGAETRERTVAAATGCYLLAVAATAVWAALSY
ncbi:hypothetical protein [Streptomyces sp. NPDC023838]|uniref:hypothetical protein n=1 Tax=Streptomyces sp. NPDC023838 TaxID=3154325 RepID=UPI0033D235A3